METKITINQSIEAEGTALRICSVCAYARRSACRPFHGLAL